MKKLAFLFLFILQIIPCSSQKDSEFKSGSYYDLDWKEHKGFVHYKYNGQSFIKFKKNPGEKARKLRPGNISGFTVEKDFFMVMHDFPIDQAGFLIVISEDFVQVLDVGTVTLYKYYSQGGRGLPGGVPGMGPSFGVYISRPDYLENFLLQEKGSEEIIAVREKKKKFIKQMSKFFGGYPEIVEKIENEEWGFEDMPEIVKFYNSYSEGGSVKKDGF